MGEDLISRQAVIDIINNNVDLRTRICIKDAIMRMPSINLGMTIEAITTRKTTDEEVVVMYVKRGV